MALIKYIDSNIENLAEELAVTLNSIYKREDFCLHRCDYIVVQSRGMEQYLKYIIAEKNNIFSFIKFPFPEVIINSFFPEESLEKNGERIKEKVVTKDLLVWLIFKELICLTSSDNLSDNDGELYELYEYLLALKKRDSTDDRSTFIGTIFRCSMTLADLFYKYMIYRLDLLLTWEGIYDESCYSIKFKVNNWQRRLWRKIFVDEIRNTYITKKVYTSLKDGSLPGYISKSGIRRLFIFGIGSMPPIYLNLFLELSKYIDVFFFYRTISLKYWVDSFSDKEFFKYYLDLTDYIDYFELEKNELLGLFARREREFFSLLVEQGVVDYDDFKNSSSINCNSIPSIPKDTLLLHRIQRDILTMSEPKYGDREMISINDRSIEFHSFYSRMREIEFLYNFIIDAIEENNGPIAPNDIIVMAPDIEKYVPYIDAVFGSKKGSNGYIFYTISDRTVESVNIKVRIFLDILKFLNSRFKASDFVKLLNHPVVVSNFNLSFEDIALIEKWLRESNIRWGLDEIHRDNILHGFSLKDGSWKAGIDRMITGYAMDFEIERDRIPLLRFGDNRIVPYPEIAEEYLDTFIKFLSIFNIFSNIKDMIDGICKGDDSISWRNVLLEIVTSIIDTKTLGTPDDEIGIIYDEIDNFLNNLESVSIERNIDLESIISYFTKRFKHHVNDIQFLKGGISFCNFKPMRSIPAKIICMIGMNDGEFPRSDIKLDFDITHAFRRKCDFSLKDDDRYSFLDGIISAKERIYISYIGLSLKDNSLIPPSIVVSQLKEYIDDNYFILKNEDIVNEEEPLSELLTVNHPLYSFNYKYFEDSNRIFSYSKQDCLIAKTSLSIGADTRELVRDRNLYTLSIYPGYDLYMPIECNIEDIVKFFQDPIRYFFKINLGIDLDDIRKDILEDREVIDIDRLTRYRLNLELFKFWESIDSIDRDDLYFYLREEGMLPAGELGRVAFKNIMLSTIRIRDIIFDIFDLSSKITIPNFSLDIDLELCHSNMVFTKDFSVSKSIELPKKISYSVISDFKNIYRDGQLFIKYGKLRAKDIIKGWIYHLFFNVVCRYNNCSSQTNNTYLISIPNEIEKGMEIFYFRSFDLEKARILIEKLLSLFFKGSFYLLPIIPELSMDIVRRYLKCSSIEEAYKKAIADWNRRRDVRYMQDFSYNDSYLKLLIKYGFLPKSIIIDSSLTLFEDILESLEKR